MSQPLLCRRRVARVSLRSLLIFLALVSTVAPAAAPAVACPNCNCNYSADCAVGLTCLWTGNNCRVWYANGLRIDGVCTAAGAGAIGSGQAAVAAQALDFWLQAYERAGLAGGEPDAKLVAQALSLPLTPAQHGAIRQAAIQMETILFGGSSHAEGRLAFSAPDAAPADATCIVETGAAPLSPATSAVLVNGSLERLGPDDLGVAALVREAVVAELAQPFHGDFAKVMARIPEELPRFTAAVVCADPRADGGRFPYRDGLDCLRHELLRSVRSLLLEERGVPSPRGAFLSE